MSEGPPIDLGHLHPAPGTNRAPKRVGRGPGSGQGKTAGRGHKGQRARAGGYHKIGFEGGQMPLHRRLPKRGFKSMSRRFVVTVRLSELQRLTAETIDLTVLRQAGLVPVLGRAARIVRTGDIKRRVTVQGVGVTAGARAAIEAAGGSVAA